MNYTLTKEHLDFLARDGWVRLNEDDTHFIASILLSSSLVVEMGGGSGYTKRALQRAGVHNIRSWDKGYLEGSTYQTSWGNR